MKITKIDDIINTTEPIIFGKNKEEKKPMNKTDLIEVVAKEVNLKKKDAEAAVNSVLGAIEQALVEGDKVQIIGFGTFEVKDRAAKTGRTPKTGEVIDIDACKQIKFSAGKTLKDKING